jgi:hypothetical protein
LDTSDRLSTVSDGPEGSALEVVAVSITVVVTASLEDMMEVAVDVGGGRMEETMR